MTERRDVERWRPIALAPGYEVSDFGRIRNASGRIMTPPLTRGYPRAGFWVSGKKRCLFVHRCVAAAFIDNPTGPVVRHLDGNPANNRSSNLAWGTYLDNEADKLRHGRRARGQRNSQAKLRDSDLPEIRRRLMAGETKAAIGRAFGVSRSAISLIARGKKWTY